MSTTLGRRLDQLRIFLVRESRQTIALEWLDDDGAPTALADTASVALELDDESGQVYRTWDGVTVGSTTHWDLTAAQTELPLSTYKGRVVITDGDPSGPLVALLALITVQ